MRDIDPDHLLRLTPSSSQEFTQVTFQARMFSEAHEDMIPDCPISELEFPDANKHLVGSF